MADFPPLTPEQRASIEYHMTCCQCGKPQTVDSSKRLELCWFRDDDHKCRHIFCEQHGQYVGEYKPGHCAMYWCNCHEAVCLPTRSEPWENVTVDSDGILDEGSSDVEWDTRERLRREHKAFRRDEGQPTSSSSAAAPPPSQSPRQRIGSLLQVMQVLQDLGLKILALHAAEGPSHGQSATGPSTSSTTPIQGETGYEPPYPTQETALQLQMSTDPPTTDPVLMQLYRNDALTQVQQAQTVDETIKKMEEEHRAFHDAIQEGILRSVEAKVTAQPEPVTISKLSKERAEQVVASYVTEVTDRLAILMKLNDTVPAVNLIARVPIGDVDNFRSNAQVRLRRTTRKQQRRFAQAKTVTKAVLQSEYYADLKVLEAMVQQIKAASP